MLGPIFSDNLINAENVLVAERENDKIVLEKTLLQISEKMKLIWNETLIFIDMDMVE